MNCRKVSHLLSAYMDGELPGVEHRQIHEHLAQCEECASEHEALLRTKRLLAGLKMRQPQVDLPYMIARRIAMDSAPARRPLTWMERVTEWWNSASPAQQVLAAGVGVALITIAYTSYAERQNETTGSITFVPRSAASDALAAAPAPDDGLSNQTVDLKNFFDFDRTLRQNTGVPVSAVGSGWPLYRTQPNRPLFRSSTPPWLPAGQ